MTADPHRRLFAAHALLPQGWARDVLVAWDDDGTLTEVTTEVPAPADVPRAAGPLVPGMPNLHSHAFQRAFAGLSEYRSGAADGDSFWTWRELMYRVALALSPDQLEAVATQLYIEMLRCGYTSVCEFHYLHHDTDGRPFADPAEMSMRLLGAAQRTGIGVTLLPVLYQHAGFGAQPARAEQRRFVNSVDALLDIMQRVRTQGARTGAAPHSLRAVGPVALRELVAGAHAIDASAPIHIHIAEQQQEVHDCIAWSGQPPVAWLLANAEVDARWCLVHATHMGAAECRGVGASGAAAGLCPSTEANLGDGVFDASAYTAAKGVWGIGSDSQTCVSVAEELRQLEYTQRLALEQRNVLASDAHRSVADHLWLSAVRGGARASGRAVGGLVAGQQADFAALSIADTFAGLSPPQVLASHLFASRDGRAVTDVWVGGQQRIRDGAHALDRVACNNFVAARRRLLSEI